MALDQSRQDALDRRRTIRLSLEQCHKSDRYRYVLVTMSGLRHKNHNMLYMEDQGRGQSDTSYVGSTTVTLVYCCFSSRSVLKNVFRDFFVGH